MSLSGAVILQLKAADIQASRLSPLAMQTFTPALRKELIVEITPGASLS
jgi:hypothetical protein